MAIEGHVAELKRRHQALDRTIEQEEARPSHDARRVTELKRQKLKLKDEIERLRN